MERGDMVFRKLLFVMAGICVFFLFACAPKPLKPAAEFDTPMHHISTGMKLLKSGNIDGAFFEFNRAKELDPEYSPAYAGIGLVHGFRNDFKKGLTAMTTAGKFAKDGEEEAKANVGYMRLYMIGKEKIEKKWLKYVEKRFKRAVKASPDMPDPYFYMGLAYKMNYDFQKAAIQFSKVLDLDKGFVAEADKEYEIVQKIERAMPGSKVGKKIALVEKITRADIAALFIEELKVDQYLKKRTPKEFDTSFKSPEKNFYTGEYVKAPSALDIDNHVLKADIDAAIETGIKGLQPFPDHKFRPYKTITRAEYAMMLEDILIKITGVDELATRYIGSISPFPDLRNDLPYYNAVMICTTCGFMVAEDLATGEFNPMGTISGADALLSIRAFKTELQKY